ncbi:MAG TPA: hypothetical protein VHN20_11690 [Beijerinckiaceae bacterium]|nr:hypothetical protein [Beijerinckiaceae bacterium]
MSGGISPDTRGGAGLVRFAPPAIAAAHFAFSYAFAALACARRWADAHVVGFAIVPAVIVIATAVSLAAIATIALANRGRRGGPGASGSGDRFLVYAWRVLALLAAAAVVLTAAPALFVPSCR